MVLVAADGAVHIQRAEVREVYDVSGAGDTAVAAVAASLAAGLNLTDAARLANTAAGIVVSKVGTAVVYSRELTAYLSGHDLYNSDKVLPRANALDLVERWRRQGLTIGFHQRLFRFAAPWACGAARASQGSLRSVGRRSQQRRVDGAAEGPRRPVQTETARAEVPASLAAVDLIVIFEEDTPIDLIEAVRPQLLVKGADYRVDEVVGAEFVRRIGGEVLLAEVIPGYSTTATIARLAR